MSMRCTPRLTQMVLLGLVVLGVPTAHAAPITLPAGLAPGDTYFLVFYTLSNHDGDSSNIADYDAFVTAQANEDADLAALGTTWKAIVSTATVDAITHIGVTGPVYNLGGQQVASGSPDMFDGTLSAPIGFDQHGDFRPKLVWTGSTPQGTGDGHELGNPFPNMGFISEIDGDWIGIHNEVFAGHEGVAGLYSISGPLLVPTPVPEPNAISLMLGPLLLLGGAYRRGRHRRATPTTQFQAR
jgi:hypothetical protein